MSISSNASFAKKFYIKTMQEAYEYAQSALGRLSE